MCQYLKVWPSDEKLFLSFDVALGSRSRGPQVTETRSFFALPIP